MRNVFNARAIARVLLGRAKTIELLRPALSRLEKEVRIAACLVLAEAMFDFEGCLKRLIQDDQTSPEEKRMLEKRLAAVSESSCQLRTAFLSSTPGRWIESTAAGTKPEDIADLLTVLTLNPNPAVKRKACTLLRERFPAADASRCLEK